MPNPIYYCRVELSARALMGATAMSFAATYALCCTPGIYVFLSVCGACLDRVPPSIPRGS